jgi:drug/metabolite transporter (DMT)-like permease
MSHADSSSKTPGAIAGALATALAFGGMFAVAKSAFVHLDPFHLTLARFILGSVIFVIALLVVEGRAALHHDGRLFGLWVLGSLGFAVFNLLTYVGLQSTPAPTASLIMATMPAITTLVVWARHKTRPTAATLGLILLALIGVATVLGSGNPLAVVTGGIGPGALLILAGVVGWVVYTTGTHAFPHFSVLRYTAITSVLGTVTIAVVTLIAGFAGWIPTPGAAQYAASWWQILYMAVPATAIAILAFNHAGRTLGPANAVLFINLVPITAFVIEAVRGHQPTAGEITGVVITLGAVVANNLYSRHLNRASAPKPAPAPAPASTPAPSETAA